MQLVLDVLYQLLKLPCCQWTLGAGDSDAPEEFFCLKRLPASVTLDDHQGR